MFSFSRWTLFSVQQRSIVPNKLRQILTATISCHTGYTVYMHISHRFVNSLSSLKLAVVVVARWWCLQLNEEDSRCAFRWKKRNAFWRRWQMPVSPVRPTSSRDLTLQSCKKHTQTCVYRLTLNIAHLLWLFWCGILISMHLVDLIGCNLQVLPRIDLWNRVPMHVWVWSWAYPSASLHSTRQYKHDRRSRSWSIDESVWAERETKSYKNSLVDWWRFKWVDV